jgi:hypothetical protein
LAFIEGFLAGIFTGYATWLHLQINRERRQPPMHRKAGCPLAGSPRPPGLSKLHARQSKPQDQPGYGRLVPDIQVQAHCANLPRERAQVECLQVEPEKNCSNEDIP